MDLKTIIIDTENKFIIDLYKGTKWEKTFKEVLLKIKGAEKIDDRYIRVPIKGFKSV